MTQRHNSHPEGLPACAAGHRARNILDLRGPAAGGGHFVECACRHTVRHAQFDDALASWRKMNRPPRTTRKVTPAADAPADNVVQLDFALAVPATGRQRAAVGRHGGR